MTKKKAAVWIILFALMIIGPRVVYYFAEPHISEENTENRQLAGSSFGADQRQSAQLCIPVQQLL